MHLRLERFRDRKDLCIVNGLAGKVLAALFRLRGEHQKPVRAPEPARFRLQQKFRARGVVDHVQRGLQPRQPMKVHRRDAGIRIHADGRRVDGDLRVRMPVQIFIVVFPVPRDHHDLARAEPPEHILRRRRSAAAAEDERLFPGDVRAAGLHQHRKAVGVGIVAPERPVRPADERVDRADGPSRVGKFCAVGDHILFIRDRDVQSVEGPFL